MANTTRRFDIQGLDIIKKTYPLLWGQRKIVFQIQFIEVRATKANIRPPRLLSFNLFVIAPRLLAKKIELHSVY